MEVEKKTDRKVVLRPGKSIDINTFSSIKKEISKLIAEGYKKLIMDFSRVKYIDSNGLGVLLFANNELNQTNGKLEIINVNSDYVKEMFSMLNLREDLNIEEY